MSTGYAQLVYPPSNADLDEGRDYGRANPAQLRYESLATETQVFVAGFGTGKTCVGARKAIFEMLYNPGIRGIAIGPSHRHAEVQYHEMMRQLDLIRLRNDINLVRRSPSSKQERLIELSNGSLIVFLSGANAIGALGPSVGFVWYDEVEWSDNPKQVWDALTSRLRQQSQPRVAKINRLRAYVTSTAQYLTGFLREKIDESQLELQRATGALKDDIWRREQNSGIYTPRTGCIIAPSTVGIGYSLTLDMLRRWKREMDPSAFQRAVMCVLKSPPEVIFGDYVREGYYPQGNVLDGREARVRPDLDTYFLVDWGNQHPHVLLTQLDRERDALIVCAEWGPDGSSVGETVLAMQYMAEQYNLLIPGTTRPRKNVNVIGDPTTNPGANRNSIVEKHAKALEGQAVLANEGWPYSFPGSHRERQKSLQIELLRLLLKPPAGRSPRILFHKTLTLKKDERHGVKQSKRGIYHALSEGYKNKVINGRIMDEPAKDGKWDHAVDALAYGAVMIFRDDFQNLFSLRDGLLSGAGAWQT